MTRQTTFIYSLFCCFLIISISCKKANETYPEVEILAPTEGATYSFGDTIFLTVEVAESDATPLISVLDGTTNIGLSYNRLVTNGNVKDFEIYFDKPQIKSGTYTIRVTASNGSNSRSDFIDIYYKELPLEYLGFVAIAANGIIKVDDQGTSESRYLGNYELLAYNALQGRAVAGSQTNGTLQGYLYSPLQLEYNVISGTGVNSYNALVNDGEKLYSLATNGEVKAYGADGAIVRSFFTEETLEPLCGSFGDEGMAVCVKERGKENYFLQILNPTNGAKLKQKALPGEVIGIVNPASGLYTIAMKTGGKTTVANYQPGTNTLTTLFTLNDAPTCIFSEFERASVVSTTQGIYVFDAQSGALPVKIYDFSAHDISYDKVSQQLLIVSGNMIYRGDFSGSTPSVYHQEIKDILQVEAVHNR